MFLEENTIINQVSIESDNSAESTAEITYVSMPVTVTIHIKKSREYKKNKLTRGNCNNY
jgi:hypothetical protein